MPNEKLLRLLLLLTVAAIHVFLLFFLAFKVSTVVQEAPENARVMKLTDLDEAPPPPPPPQEEELPQVEAIAETMIETDEPPVQVIVAPGSITTPAVIVETWEDYLPIHRVSDPPKFDEREIMAGLVYPPIAQRSGIEGRVILELFVDRDGLVQQIRILLEEPPDRGFGEAAVKAFSGKRGTPARANGEPVLARYRYPLRFTIR